MKCTYHFNLLVLKESFLVPIKYWFDLWNGTLLLISSPPSWPHQCKSRTQPPVLLSTRFPCLSLIQKNPWTQGSDAAGLESLFTTLKESFSFLFFFLYNRQEYQWAVFSQRDLAKGVQVWAECNGCIQISPRPTRAHLTITYFLNSTASLINERNVTSFTNSPGTWKGVDPSLLKP